MFDQAQKLPKKKLMMNELEIIETDAGASMILEMVEQMAAMRREIIERRTAYGIFKDI